MKKSLAAPTCILLSGLPGSGKTKLALELAKHGFIRICPDEEMHKRHGKRGLDFPRSQYLVLERPVLDDLATDLRAALSEGRDTVFDHGLWTPAERREWVSLATDTGAAPLLVYLPASHDVRWRRVKQRNQQGDSLTEFSQADLLRYSLRFQPPGEAEPHLKYDGSVATVMRAARDC